MILQHYKIVFAGSMGAGKTTAIQTISNIDILSTEAINTDLEAHSKQLTTVGIDYGEITLEDGVKVGLYGTPGQDRFDFIWDVITQGAIGTIILIDHSVANPLLDLERYVEYFQNKTTNIVIAITHTDVKTTHHTRIYYDWMQQKSYSLPLFFIDARIKNDILLLLNALISSAEIEAQFSEQGTAP